VHVAGTANYGRRLAQAQAGRFAVEQYVRLSEGGDVKCYVWKAGGPAEDVTGPMWAAGAGRFGVLDGDGAGSGRWVETGLACGPDRWYKVMVRIDVPQRAWAFLVDGKEFKAGHPLGFRGPEAGALNEVNDLTEASAGFYLDALRALRLPSGKADRPGSPGQSGRSPRG
jgi:hypothetical protein